jgi:AAA+ ATPase superfamily predicted ATPase
MAGEGDLNSKWGFSENPFAPKTLESPEELEQLFVNRETEIKEIYNGLTSTNGGIVYGITGLRGSGKSSLLNKVLHEIEKRNKGLVLKIDASGKYRDIEFLESLLGGICEGLKEKNLSDVLKAEIARIQSNLFFAPMLSEMDASPMAYERTIASTIYDIYGSDITTQKHTKLKTGIEKQLRHYNKSTIINETLHFLKRIKEEMGSERLIIAIDETDKCEFEDAYELFNCIKPVFQSKCSNFVFVGTCEFYENFKKSFSDHTRESSITSSIFHYMVYVEPFDKSSDKSLLKEMIQKRLNFYSTKIGGGLNPFQGEAMKMIFEISNGFPRQLFRLCAEAYNSFGEKGEEIRAEHVKDYFIEKRYFSVGDIQCMV